MSISDLAQAEAAREGSGEPWGSLRLSALMSQTTRERRGAVDGVDMAADELAASCIAPSIFN